MNFNAIFMIVLVLVTALVSIDAVIIERLPAKPARLVKRSEIIISC